MRGYSPHTPPPSGAVSVILIRPPIHLLLNPWKRRMSIGLNKPAGSTLADRSPPPLHAKAIIPPCPGTLCALAHVGTLQRSWATNCDSDYTTRKWSRTCLTARSCAVRTPAHGLFRGKEDNGRNDNCGKSSKQEIEQCPCETCCCAR